MHNELILALSPETLHAGSAEEQATFGQFSMVANNSVLTKGEDVDTKEKRHGPYVSGYPIAEWLAWNWWRLRWEIDPSSDENTTGRWNSAHRMSTIGEGYTWPNITIRSDGMRFSLSSAPSLDSETSRFHYNGADQRQIVSVGSLESAVNGFVQDMLTRLGEAGVRGTNLHHLWDDLKSEREDPQLMQFRRLEAQLGYDPDEADENAIYSHLNDMTKLGEEALGEIAAAATLEEGDALSHMMSAEFLETVAQRDGFETNPKSAITVKDMEKLPQPGQVKAGDWGQCAAQEIRAQENLGGRSIDDVSLADFTGVVKNAVSSQRRCPSPISFAFDTDEGSKIALRSSRKTGRRFALARIMGDRVLRKQIQAQAEPLLPLTHAFSYRQKAQRAFAAELLSPFDCVSDMMNGDFSNEKKQNIVADYFDVSPMTIRNQLFNHWRISPDDASDILGRSAY